MDHALDFLERIGASRLGHLRGTLMSHLVGTWRLLQAWDCDTSVCLAGLFHSVYGTQYYAQQSVLLSERSLVREQIGEEAEYLAFLFCMADRPQALWTVRHTHLIADRMTGQSHPVSLHQVQGLIEIECANCLEQGLGRPFLKEAWASFRGGRLALRAPIAAAVAHALDA